MEPYRKHVSYLFTVCGELFSISAANDGSVDIEECAKDGQEDTHRVGVISKNEAGRWEWTEGERQFVTYGGRFVTDQIIEYLNTHEPPCE